jgi:hypothetical protein
VGLVSRCLAPSVPTVHSHPPPLTGRRSSRASRARPDPARTNLCRFLGALQAARLHTPFWNVDYFERLWSALEADLSKGKIVHEKFKVTVPTRMGRAPTATTAPTRRA